MQLHDTYFVVGHFHLMIGGVTLLGSFAAIYFWFPKMFGRTMNETLGKAHFWFTLIPFFTVFFMQHFQGLQGAPRRYFGFMSYEYLQETRDTNWLISMAAFTLIAGQVLFLVNFIMSLAKKKEVVPNPWHATTLEWTLPSPPAHGNFGDAIPEVYRWPYEYSAEEADEDYTPQTVPADKVPVTA